MWKEGFKQQKKEQEGWKVLLIVLLDNCENLGLLPVSSSVLNLKNQIYNYMHRWGVFLKNALKHKILHAPVQNITCT